MKKITKKQRNEMYKRALNDNSGNIKEGLCVLLRYIHTGKYEWNPSEINCYRYTETQNYFKEFALFLDREGEYNNDIRRLILMFCIEMTEVAQDK